MAARAMSKSAHFPLMLVFLLAAQSGQCESLGPEKTIAPQQGRPEKGEAAQRGNPLWSHPLAELAATRERPLFSSTRRPPPPTPIAAPAQAAVDTTATVEASASERPPWTLVGTIVGADTRIAFFLDPSTNEVMRLHEGEQEFGWRLRKVEFRAIVVQKDSRIVRFELPKPADPVTTAEIR
jgi:general secretion pathway protein N